MSATPKPTAASEYAQLVEDLRRYQRVADRRTRYELDNAADAIERLAGMVDEANQSTKTKADHAQD